MSNTEKTKTYPKHSWDAPAPPFSWTNRYPFGFGRNRREQLLNDLAKVIHVHGLDDDLHRSAVVLADQVVNSLIGE